MTGNKKTNITLLILAAVVFLLIFLAVSPIFRQIKNESEDFVAQKKALLELEAKIKNIHDFRNNFKQYQVNLEKIGKLFVDTAEPIEFIEFLEKEAAASQLSIKIFSSLSSEFNLELVGSFSDFSRFLERLEYSPYLITSVNLSIRKISEKNDNISAALLIKAYVK